MKNTMVVSLITVTADNLFATDFSPMNQREYTQDWLVVFYSILTLVGYLMPNPIYTYILNRKENGLFVPNWLAMFYGISTLVGYLMPNPIYTYILNREENSLFVPNWLLSYLYIYIK